MHMVLCFLVEKNSNLGELDVSLQEDWLDDEVVERLLSRHKPNIPPHLVPYPFSRFHDVTVSEFVYM